MADADPIRDACPNCGALLAEDDVVCPRCGADVSRDRTLREPVPSTPEGPLPDPERVLARREGKAVPPEDRDYRVRKPAYEGGLRPPVPDED